MWKLFTTTQVAVQIAPDRLQIKAKGRSMQVHVSTFNAEMEPVRGDLNSYIDVDAYLD